MWNPATASRVAAVAVGVAMVATIWLLVRHPAGPPREATSTPSGPRARVGLAAGAALLLAVVAIGYMALAGRRNLRNRRRPRMRAWTRRSG